MANMNIKPLLFTTILFVCIINANLTFAEEMTPTESATFLELFGDIGTIDTISDNSDIIPTDDSIIINNTENSINNIFNIEPTTDIPQETLTKLDNKLSLLEGKCKKFSNQKKLKVYKALKDKIKTRLEKSISSEKKAVLEYMDGKTDEIILNIENNIQKELIKKSENVNIFEILPKNEFYGKPIMIGKNGFEYSNIKGFETIKDDKISSVICNDDILSNFLQTNYDWSYRNTCRSLTQNVISFNVLYLEKDNYFYEKHYLDKKNGLYGKILLESGTGVTKETTNTKNKELKLKQYENTKKTDNLFIEIDKLKNTSNTGTIINNTSEVGIISTISNTGTINFDIFETLPTNENTYGNPTTLGTNLFGYSNIKFFEMKQDNNISSVICNGDILNNFLQTNYDWSYRNTCKNIGENLITFNVLYLKKDNYFYEKHYLDKKNGLYGKLLLESGAGVTKETTNTKNKELKLKNYIDTKQTDELFLDIEKVSGNNKLENTTSNEFMELLNTTSNTGTIINTNNNIPSYLPTNENSYGNPVIIGRNLFSYSYIDYFEMKQDNNVSNVDCNDESLNGFLKTIYPGAYSNSCKNLSQNIISVNVIYLLNDNYFYEKLYLDKKHGLYGKMLLESGYGVLKNDLSKKNQELKLKEYEEIKKTDELFLDIDKN